MDMYQKRKMRKEKSTNEQEKSCASMNINWFPGHMAKAQRKLKESLGNVDVVIELLDARIPLSSRNPDIDKILSDKPRIIVLNKSDLSDEKISLSWKKYFENIGQDCILFSIKDSKSTNVFMNKVLQKMSYKLKNWEAKGAVGQKLRLMIVGIPNVGKSSFINRICKNSKAKVENRPGVTRSNQWFTCGDKIQILDTPGVLWPKFQDNTTALDLAFTGAIKDRILDVEDLSVRFIEKIRNRYMDNLCKRFKLDKSKIENLSSFEILEAIGRKRGALISGAEVDTTRIANIILEEFRSGKLGKITLEAPNVEQGE